MMNDTKLYYKTKLGIVRESKIEDVFNLADNLRLSDINEIWKSDHQTPESALLSGFTNSVLCFTIEHNEKPIAMFGVVPRTIIGNNASIWLLGSPEIEDIQKSFIRHSREFINMCLNYYPYLENWIDCENRESIKWLKYIGATIEEPESYGVEGALFRHFYFRRRM